ncbi:MAG: cysteine-rich CWC family protein [Polaromonas sp.]|uniref:cysteine-rich CWC family protein n=1 Tax=Polaromonas sp. TaxID=1869339 RepID=UPI00272FD101|nr:cysteine-rich CWC family protein [Polaromonas sp.]MDP2256201.1 cysteine-rich CWC family protein [Polaromonas sp.]MDP3708996.1 cysteine-rich CWC family protein [Polaromonas sp.]
MTSPVVDLPDTSRCPRCGAGLRCGMLAGDAQCWCVQLPHVMPVPSGAPSTPDSSTTSCYCPACLKQITNEQLRASNPTHSVTPD